MNKYSLFFIFFIKISYKYDNTINFCSKHTPLTNMQDEQQERKEQQASRVIEDSIITLIEERKKREETRDFKADLIPVFFDDMDEYEYWYKPEDNHQKKGLSVTDQRILSLRERIKRKGYKQIIILTARNPIADQSGNGTDQPFLLIPNNERISSRVHMFCKDLQIALYRLAATKEDIESIVFSEQKNNITCTCTLIYQ